MNATLLAARLKVCLLGLCLACSLAAAPNARAADEDDGWTDRAILLKETARPWVNEKRVTWNAVPLPGVVREVRDNWLSLGNKTWVTKNEALLVPDAPEYFAGLIKRQPNNVIAYALRGIAWQLNGEYENALKDFNEALRLEPGSATVTLLRGKAYYQLHRYDDALADFTEAIRTEPGNLVAYNDRGATLNAMGEFERAYSQFNEVLRKDPKNALAYANRGCNMCDQGKLDEALADLNKAIELNPEMSSAYCNRGKVLTKQGDYPDALADFDKALKIAPHEWPGYYGWAQIRATSPWAQLRDGKRAKEMAMKACELSHWTEALPIATLAAACAELGDFENAVRWQTKAIELTPKGKDKHHKEGEKRLALYKEGKPYYEEPVTPKATEEPLTADPKPAPQPDNADNK
ncbi:MAG: tetratricopeptide repeat protein [Planctomycetes bacterium]|nr:tetratricopeptide repeat protein [Planctomycetota bacterium]